jgi:ubiquinone/menaquinone biosynthesis C-methylase UbiE
VDGRRKFLNQWRRPTGLLGRLLARALNISHSKGTDWGFQHIAIERHHTVLDVGCGGGGTVHKLAGIAIEGKVYGIDYSQASVIAARRTNKHWIKMGRVEILLGSVSCLPFSDQMFDLVTAVNSHYYWPNLVTDLQEVTRVLKPGARLVLIGEAYKGGKYDNRNQIFVKFVDISCQSVDELSKALSMAGYIDVQMFEEYNKGWICGIGRKPL